MTFPEFKKEEDVVVFASDGGGFVIATPADGEGVSKGDPGLGDSSNATPADGEGVSRVYPGLGDSSNATPADGEEVVYSKRRGAEGVRAERQVRTFTQVPSGFVNSDLVPAAHVHMDRAIFKGKDKWVVPPDTGSPVHAARFPTSAPGHSIAQSAQAHSHGKVKIEKRLETGIPGVENTTRALDQKRNKYTQISSTVSPK